MNRTLRLLLISIFIFGCSTEQKSDANNIQVSERLEKSTPNNNTGPIGTNDIIKIVADDILKQLHGHQIRISDFDENGNFYIEYNEDPNIVDPNDFSWEYYRIEKDELITGHLNADDRLDFAIKSTWGPTQGNMFVLEWHVYVSENDKWRKLDNDFGGGKFSDLEAVISIKNGTLTTKFQELDEETGWLKDTVQLREYELIHQNLRMK